VSRLRAVSLLVVVTVCSAFAAAGAVYGVERLLHAVARGPAALTVALPAAGLLVGSAIRSLGSTRSGPSSIDAYMDAYHGRHYEDQQYAARVVGAGATVGSGGALDPVGLAVVLGTWFGAIGRRRLGSTGPSLLVVGAAAGFGAALHSPIAGGVLAVEIPFSEGMSWRRLPAALLGSTAGYLARSSIDGFHLPWWTVVGVVGLRDVLLALGLAVAAGIASRAVSLLTRSAETGLGPVFSQERHHVLTAAALLVALGILARLGFDGVPVHLGPGTISLPWAATASTAGLCALLAMRAAASGVTMLGRGVGGLVIPLLVLGSVSGQLLGHTFDGNVALLSIIGAATLLGAGYRVPLAALVWLGESTHSVPAIALGCVVVLITQTVGGGRSVSTAQRKHPTPTRQPSEPT
jgi:CIC family chloride channel protein